MEDFDLSGQENKCLSTVAYALIIRCYSQNVNEFNVRIKINEFLSIEMILKMKIFLILICHNLNQTEKVKNFPFILFLRLIVDSGVVFLFSVSLTTTLSSFFA